MNTKFDHTTDPSAEANADLNRDTGDDLDPQNGMDEYAHNPTGEDYFDEVVGEVEIDSCPEACNGCGYVVIAGRAVDCTGCPAE